MKRLFVVLLVCLCVAPMPMGFAKDGDDTDSKLERVEEQSKPSRSRRRYADEYYAPSPGTALAATAIDSFFYALFSGLFQTYNYSNLTTREFHSMLRHDYHAALPTFRFEGNYTKLVGEDVQGYRLNALGGYLVFGAEFDFVQYYENTPSTQLRIMSPRLLLRGAPSPILEVNLTLGAKILDGRRAQAGFEIGLPTYIYLGKHAIIDVKNYYSVIRGADVYDGAFGVSGKWKLLGVRGAYRIIRIGSENLHGPEAGLFVQW